MQNHTKNPTALQLIAWTSWSAFLLFSLGAATFAFLEKNDRYFVRHYQHYPMGEGTALVTTYPVWMALVPFVWLPFVIAYQRQNQPRGRMLLILLFSMLIAFLTVATLILFSGPGIQM